MNKRIILYSHGFGVKKDDRGLFTDIANDLPDIEHVMFDYNDYDDSTNTLAVTPLDKQAEKLVSEYEKIRSENPDATIDLICHSQGCVVASLAKLKGIRKTIFLAPPSKFLGAEAKIKQMSERAGTVIDGKTVSYPRRDGSTTIINSDYWDSRDRISDPIDLYNSLAKSTELVIINANKDEVLGKTDFTGLEVGIRLDELDANHDFTGEARAVLIKNVQEALSDD